MKIFESSTVIKWVRIISVVVTVCTAITMMTPSHSENFVVQKVQKVLNVLAGNVAHNTNLDDPSVPTMLQNVSGDQELEKMVKEVEDLYG